MMDVFVFYELNHDKMFDHVTNSLDKQVLSQQCHRHLEWIVGSWLKKNI